MRVELGCPLPAVVLEEICRRGGLNEQRCGTKIFQGCLPLGIKVNKSEFDNEASSNRDRGYVLGLRRLDASDDAGARPSSQKRSRGHADQKKKKMHHMSGMKGHKMTGHKMSGMSEHKSGMSGMGDNDKMPGMSGDHGKMKGMKGM